MRNNKKRIWNLAAGLLGGLLLLLCLMNFNKFTILNRHSKSVETPIYVTYSNLITNQFIKDLKKKHNFHYAGGGGGFLYDVKNITLDFESHKILNVNEARKLFLECSEELLVRINSDDKIRPFLNHFPFSNKGTALSLSFYNNKGNYLENKHVALIFSCKNSIHYYFFDPEKQKLQPFHEESYQEALNIVRSQNDTQESSDILSENPRRKLEGRT